MKSIQNLTLLSLTTSMMFSCSNTQEKPNLLIVFPDQMRGQAMGFVGEEPVKTPNLDNFAKESLVLTQAVSNYPVSSPFRAMMMTGKYSQNNKVVGNCNSTKIGYNCELQEKDTCWSDILKSKGYSMGYIGKWHLDTPHEPYIDCHNNRGKVAWNEWCPPERRHGFDFWYSYGTYDLHNKPMYWSTNAKRDEFKYVDQWGPEHEADKAIEYIKNTDNKYRDNKKPFALVVSMNPPHTPYWMVPNKYKKHYEGKNYKDLLVRKNVDVEGTSKAAIEARKQIANYYSQITGVDEQFGRILKALDEQGLAENTIVLFCSDHGNCIGSHNERTKNNHYEESMRIPFLIRWKGKIKARKDDLLLSAPDIYPTIMGLMGFNKEIPKTVEGTSYADIFRGKEGERPSSQLYLKIPFDKVDMGKRGVRTHRYTLCIEKREEKEDTIILYDNKKDKFQLENIAAKQPETVKKLIEEELQPWLKKTKDPWLK